MPFAKTVTLTGLLALAWLPTMAAPARAEGPGPSQEVDHTVADAVSKPNFPVSDISPKEARPTIPGMTLASAAVSKAAYVFTPGGSTDTRAKLDAQMYYQAIYGNQTTNQGDDGIEGDVSSNWTRARTYPESSPYNLLAFKPDGLDLGTTCSRNNTPAGCAAGHLYGAIMRLPTIIQRGDIVSITMRTGRSPRFYFGGALYAGAQHTPGPNGRPYEVKDGLQYDPNCYGEQDIGNDDYLVLDVPHGQQLKLGASPGRSYAENKDGACFVHAPRVVYAAAGPVFGYVPNTPYLPYSRLNAGHTYEGMYDYVWYAADDGSNLVYHWVGVHGGTLKLVMTEYYEQSRTTPGWSLVFKAQTVANFLNPALQAGLTPNDGAPAIRDSPLSLTVQSIHVVTGQPDPAWLKASQTDQNGAAAATPINGLRDH